MKKTVEFDEVCKSCGGTGIYSGMGEDKNSGVVCKTCNGTGCYHFKYTYEEFKRRKKANFEWIYERNPGIKVGKGNGFIHSDFGGMPFKDWIEGEPFPVKSENRKFTCPAWWYQSCNYELKPQWKECDNSLGRTFSECPYFITKEKCWERWDKEFLREAENG